MTTAWWHWLATDTYLLSFSDQRTALSR